jgi:hypothetical protein
VFAHISVMEVSRVKNGILLSNNIHTRALMNSLIDNTKQMRKY